MNRCINLRRGLYGHSVLTLEDEVEYLYDHGLIYLVIYETDEILFNPPGLNFDNSIMYKFVFNDTGGYRICYMCFPNKRYRTFTVHDYIYIKNYFRNKDIKLYLFVL